MTALQGQDILYIYVVKIFLLSVLGRNKSQKQKAIFPTSISSPLHSLSCNKSTTSSEEISPKRFFFSPEHSEWLWSKPSLLFNKYRGSFPGVNQKGHNMNHLLPYSTKAKHKLTYTSIPPLHPNDVDRVTITLFH